MNSFEEEHLAATLETGRKTRLAFFVTDWDSHIQETWRRLNGLRGTEVLALENLSKADFARIRNYIVHIHGDLELPKDEARTYLDTVIGEALLEGIQQAKDGADHQTINNASDKLKPTESESSGLGPNSLRPTAPEIPRSLRATQTARVLFSSLELILPRRIAAEEIGDALEIIAQLSRQSRPTWQIYLKVASTVFWVFINAFRELSGAILGRKRA